MEKQRIYWVDLCKGIGIFLVLMEHTLRNDVTMFICAFNMPMFFFLSGIVFNEKKHTDFKRFIKGRFNQLIIPYIFFFLLTYFLWLVLERQFRSFDMDWWQPLIGMVYASQWHGYMDHNGILWFLPCLFVVEIMNFFVIRIKPHYMQFVIVLVLLIIGFCIKINLPWCLNTACVALPFYYLGKQLKYVLLFNDVGTKSSSKKTLQEFGFLFLFGILFFAIEGIVRNSAFMINGQYGNPFIYEIVAVSGILMMVFIGKVLSPNNKLLLSSLNYVLYMGKNTLVIFALHAFFLRIARFVFERYLSISNYDTNIMWAIVIDTIVIIILCVLIPIYNRFRDNFLVRIYLN